MKRRAEWSLFKQGKFKRGKKSRMEKMNNYFKYDSLKSLIKAFDIPRCLIKAPGVDNDT